MSLRKVIKLAATLAIVAGSAFAGQTGWAASLVMDAAELGLNGQPFDRSWALWAYDNRQGATDAWGVTFDMTVYGTVTNWDTTFIGDSIWENAGYPGYLQIVDGKSYNPACVSTQRTGIWAPAFTVDPTPDQPYSGDEYDISGYVPAGVCWGFAAWWQGVDVTLFHSPAQATFTDASGTTTIYDSDRRPQLAIPEPATLSLLVVGSVALLKRRAA